MCCHQSSSLCRITPIYMGSTKFLVVTHWACKDHPHIHGEHSRRIIRVNQELGSPPYTWGAPFYLLPIRSLPRITPIYMGSTSGHVHHSPEGRDHPHIHGEHLDGIVVCVLVEGSPPYTWGARFPSSMQ